MSAIDDFYDAMHGAIFPTARLVAPDGFLMCDGSAYDRTEYGSLFSAITVGVTGSMVTGNAVISDVSSDITALAGVGMPISGSGIPAGATIDAVTATSITLSAAATATVTAVRVIVAPHGVGDGSSTFNVPDHRGRVLAGADKMGGTAANRLTTAGGVNAALLGAAGGAQTHVLATTEMPNHSHANVLNDPGHAHANSLNDPGHSHSSNAEIQNAGTSTGGGQFPATGNVGTATINPSGTGMSISNAGAGTGMTISNVAAGSGAAHPIVQPTSAVNYMIKT